MSNDVLIDEEEGLYKEVDGVDFYAETKDSKVWWVDNPNKIGVYEFSFDFKTIYNLFRDYPDKLSKVEKAVFDEENPYWANFFKDRTT